MRRLKNGSREAPWQQPILTSPEALDGVPKASLGTRAP
jgi:hypothetical protein